MKGIYWVAVTLGMILTPIAHEFETARRGYRAIGGEFLIVPLLILVALVIVQMHELTIIAWEESKEDK